MKILFDHLRSKSPLGPKLDQGEVDGVEAVLKSLEGSPTSYVAYALATVYHETNGTMRPIPERGSKSYFRRMYDVQGASPDRARKHGNTQPGDGEKYFGRGYVQLTWKNNYAMAGEALHLDLVSEPGMALIPEVAANILRQGMLEGWFQGRKLSDCFPKDQGTRDQFIRARGIISNDRAEDIADYALLFQDALNAAGYAS